MEKNKKKPSEAKTPEKSTKKKPTDTMKNKTPKLESSSITKSKTSKANNKKKSEFDGNQTRSLEKESKNVHSSIKEIAREDFKDLNLKNKNETMELSSGSPKKGVKGKKKGKKGSPGRRKKVINQNASGGSCCNII